MGPTPRCSISWISVHVDRSLFSSRASMLRLLFLMIGFCIIAYLLWLPVVFFFGALVHLSSHHAQLPVIRAPGEDTLKHFAGSRDCNILQSDIYFVPRPSIPKTSPFCKNRATLLQAVSAGGRHAFDKPFVGKGCTYRWFPTREICMILDRFNTITFVGDDIAQAVYSAFNILLREDVARGGLYQNIMGKEDRKNCKCSNQFLNQKCLKYTIESSLEIKNIEASGTQGSPYLCSRIPHSYIRVDATPAPEIARTHFRDQIYSRPNPWQPSPLIISLSHSTLLSPSLTTKALDEWTTLATAAERNIPILFLGPTAAHGLFQNGSTVIGDYQMHMTSIAKEMHFDVLNFYNLTAQAMSSADGERYGEEVALVQAMMFVNWLAMLETS